MPINAQTWWIPTNTRGRLGITPRPRGGDWLPDEISAWRRAGVDTVVSLLTPAEVEEFDLHDEPNEAQQQGLAFCSIPIQDRGVPDITVLEPLGWLRQALLDGKSVVVHCRQSIGRSAVLTALLLLSLGENPENVFSLITQARGRDVPDTVEQRDWTLSTGSDIIARMAEES